MGTYLAVAFGVFLGEDRDSLLIRLLVIIKHSQKIVPVSHCLGSLLALASLTCQFSLEVLEILFSEHDIFLENLDLGFEIHILLDVLLDILAIRCWPGRLSHLLLLLRFVLLGSFLCEDFLLLLVLPLSLLVIFLKCVDLLLQIVDNLKNVAEIFLLE